MSNQHHSFTLADGEVLLQSADSIELRLIEWIWDGWLAKGKLHILAGAPGTGKTTILMSLAATVSSGGVWPDGLPCEQGNVLIWSGEDDPADTLVPRLKAMNANLERVHFISGVHHKGGHVAFDPAVDMPKLVKRLEELKPSLLIIDPIVSAVAGDKFRAPEEIEEATRTYFRENPYNAQRVEGFAGPHALTESRLGTSAVMRVRPMVQLFDKEANLVAEVPLPIARHKQTVRKFGKVLIDKTDYEAITANPVYEKVAWAHKALQALAAEYDQLEAAGLGDLFVHFHGGHHRLSITEKGPDALNMIGNKLGGNLDDYLAYYEARGEVDTGFMSAQQLTAGASVHEHFITLNAASYANQKAPILGHELSHRIDLIESPFDYCYSNNALFEQAVTQDVCGLKGSLRRLQKCITYPLFESSDIFIDRNQTHKEAAREAFGTLFEEWISDPKSMQRDFPNVHAYIERFVMPDLRLRQKTGEDRSYLKEVISSAEGKNMLKDFRQALPEGQSVIRQISDIRYDINQQFGSKDLEKQAYRYAEKTDILLANLPPQNKSANAMAEELKAMTQMCQRRMLKAADLTEIPQLQAQGPRATGR